MADDIQEWASLAERLDNRAKQDRSIAENCRIVCDLLRPELEKFEARDAPWNTYAVRMAVDHENSRKRDTQFADDLEAAAILATDMAGLGVDSIDELLAQQRDYVEAIKWLAKGVDFERNMPNWVRPTIRKALELASQQGGG